MEHALGLLRVKVLRGVNLVKADANGSDPYLVLIMGNQKLRTGTKKNNCNPEWNEDLTLCVSYPIHTMKIEVFDKDTFTQDDKLGDAELDIQPFLDVVKMDLEGIPDGTVITTVKPNRQNCLAGESSIFSKGGMVAQDVALRLRNVASGEVELQLLWVTIPGGASFI